MDDQSETETGGTPVDLQKQATGPRRIAEVLLHMFELQEVALHAQLVAATAMQSLSEEARDELLDRLAAVRDEILPTLYVAAAKGRFT